MAKKAKPMDRLTILSIAAQKEGLSYGKYMVKYNYDPPCLKNLPEEIIPPAKKDTVPQYLKDMEPYIKPQRNCRHCGKSFEPESGNQFYCTQECHRKAAKAREKQKALAGKVQRYCVICGAPLPLEISARRLTCAKKCSEAHKLNYMREKNKREWQKRKQSSEKGA